MANSKNITHYYQLAKPGMVYGNAFTTLGGFMLAAKTHVDLWRLAGTLIGLSLVIASACVFNNMIDRRRDALMERTKSRSLATGQISNDSAAGYAITLGIVGFITLIIFTNWLATVAAAVGFFFYVFMYSLWFKPRSRWAALVGSVSGAVPPVVGYTAASNHFDAAALLLFFIMVIWQMPHFYAIAIRRLEEYKAAGYPVMPAAVGIRSTQIRMLGYIIAFTLIAPLLSILGYISYSYFFTALILGIIWLALCIKGFSLAGNPPAVTAWAKSMFLYSLASLTLLFTVIIMVSLV